MNTIEEPKTVQEIHIIVRDDGSIKLHSYGEKGESGMNMKKNNIDLILNFAREIIEEVKVP